MQNLMYKERLLKADLESISVKVDIAHLWFELICTSIFIIGIFFVYLCMIKDSTYSHLPRILKFTLVGFLIYSTAFVTEVIYFLTNQDEKEIKPIPTWIIALESISNSALIVSHWLFTSHYLSSACLLKHWQTGEDI